ncbi:acyl-CoA dehydrogenase family protein [Paracoccus marinus]|uniref:acyl-CoA dehydrogenase family protein n=1 Tax=Paracoccus marinus TaxID=288426 RepID=UPI001C8F3520|nr:acyl-CoA dehydrogenase family protein [Paracoccus marinus]
MLPLLPAIRAAADDPGAADHGPARAITLLRDAGLLVAALPEAAGGEGVGTSPHTARDTATLLRRLGRADLSAARLFEGHVNAVKLIALHGGDEVRGRAFDLVRAGGLLGVWGADDGAPVQLDRDGTGEGDGTGRADAWGASCRGQALRVGPRACRCGHRHRDGARRAAHGAGRCPRHGPPAPGTLDRDRHARHPLGRP